MFSKAFERTHETTSLGIVHKPNLGQATRSQVTTISSEYLVKVTLSVTYLLLMEYLGYSGLFELLMNAQLNDGT